MMKQFEILWELPKCDMETWNEQIPLEKWHWYTCLMQSCHNNWQKMHCLWNAILYACISHKSWVLSWVSPLSLLFGAHSIESSLHLQTWWHHEFWDLTFWRIQTEWGNSGAFTHCRINLDWWEVRYWRGAVLLSVWTSSFDFSLCLLQRNSAVCLLSLLWGCL